MHLRSIVAVAVLLAVASLATACGGDNKDKTTAPSASDATVAVASVGSFGKLLVGPNGHTLYLFEKDQGTTSACTGGCADTWPALTASGKPAAGSGVDGGKLATADGQVANQVVFNGHLLYYFAPDTAAGDVKGASIPSWYPVDPDGNKIDRD